MLQTHFRKPNYAENRDTSDLGAELAEAMRWYAAETEMKAFLEHVRGEHSWSERRPRKLLAWADRQAVPVFGARRFVTVLLAGFDGPDRGGCGERQRRSCVGRVKRSPAARKRE